MLPHFHLMIFSNWQGLFFLNILTSFELSIFHLESSIHNRYIFSPFERKFKDGKMRKRPELENDSQAQRR